MSVDMSVFIREIWVLCREIMRAKDIIPTLDVSLGFPRCLVFDAERITQVVMNLVSNATKFTQKGYIKVSFDWKPLIKDNLISINSIFFTSYKDKLEKELDQETNIYPPGWFHNAADDEKGSFFISVEDTGSGISEKNQKIIYDKFAQVIENLESQTLGLGLGLWISKAIIKEHGGDIFLKSREGAGSCFTATIPTTSKPFQQVNRVSPQSDQKIFQKKSCLRALVVEDIPINQNINSEMLKKYGFTHIEIAADGKEGLETFQNRGPSYFDLVTVDLEMPVMKGKEAITLMRKWEAENKIPPTKTIVISGNAIEKEVNECLDAKVQADAFLAKPCSYKALEETITRFESEGKVPQLLNKNSKSSIIDHQTLNWKKRPKVLFADDDFFNLDILIAYAEKMGLEYLVAKDGEETCSIFENTCETIDVVLVDYYLPILNGPEVCDRIRRIIMRSARRNCKICLLSGLNQVKSEVARKFDGIIYKPLTFEKFEELFTQKISP